MKIPKESKPRRKKSNKTKVFKRRKTNENASASKGNKDKVIDNKAPKDKSFNSKR